MTGGSVLPETSTTPFWLGSYPTISGPYINPLSRTGITNWNENTLAYLSFLDPSQKIPGDIGDLTYYPSFTNPWKSSFAMTMSYPPISESYSALKSEYAAYNTTLADYNTKKEQFTEAFN
jgi:hypothetical protein